MKLIANSKYKVKWIDIQSFPEWTPRSEILALEPVIVESVYIYVGKGKAGLCFASEYNDSEFGNTTIIPKGAIISHKLIK